MTRGATAHAKSRVIRDLIDSHTNDSMYPAIPATDLMRLLFLLPDDATLNKVKQQITAARAARRGTHAFLEKAKRAVELAMEDPERSALRLVEG